MSIKAIVLAAGQGKRMVGGDLPKVMQPVCGKPMISYVLRALGFLPPEDIVVVVGFQKEKVTEACGPKYQYAVQKKQLGTGHAVQSASPLFKGFDGQLLVCYGDMPLVRRETYQALIDTHNAEGNACTLLSGTTSENLGLGRIVRDADGRFTAIVEEADCTEEQKGITECNAAIYVFESALLWDALGKLKNDNAQGEYYITDVPSLLLENGNRVGVRVSSVPDEILGVNTREHLEHVEYCVRSAGLVF